jgi:hypothetical protein
VLIVKKEFLQKYIIISEGYSNDFFLLSPHAMQTPTFLFKLSDGKYYGALLIFTHYLVTTNACKVSFTEKVEIIVHYLIKSRSVSFCAKPRDWRPKRS